jgi:hypothetical protein
MLILPSVSVSSAVFVDVELLNGFFTASLSFTVVLLCSGAPSVEGGVEVSVGSGGEMGSVYLLVLYLDGSLEYNQSLSGVGGVWYRARTSVTGVNHAPWNCASMLDSFEVVLAAPGSSATGGSTIVSTGPYSLPRRW